MRTVGSTRAWAGGQITECARAVLAPNPGAMTLDGTNTWLLQRPDEDEIVLIDPGPADPAHLQAVMADVEAYEGRVATILLTHGHDDHAGGAAMFAEAFGCGVRALDPQHRLGSEGLASKDVITAGSLEVHVVGTPGHTRDSLTFWFPEEGALLTGDTIIGRGTTVVAHPDGRLSDYLNSLNRLRLLAERQEAAHVLPGHGPSLGKPLSLIDDYIEHRHQRLAQVRAATEAGAETVKEVVALVYTDLPEVLWPAAELSVRAQLDYLDSRPRLG